MAAKRTSFEEVGWEDMPDDANVGPHNVRRAQVAVSSIIVDDRFGRVHDDSLIEAEIIQRYGLLYPITVDKDLRLLAGDQWLAAVKKLGWPTVEVLIVETA